MKVLVIKNKINISRKGVLIINKELLINKIEKCRETHTIGYCNYVGHYIYHNLTEDEIAELIGTLLYRRPLDNGFVIRDWIKGI